MEIGPITGIRPISMVKPPSPAPDLSGVFAVEFRGRQQDESSNSSRRASRGLEKEAEDEDLADDSLVASEDAQMSSVADPLPLRQISIFA